MEINEWKNRKRYEALPEWRKLLWALRSAIRAEGLAMIVLYPYAYWKLTRFMKQLPKGQWVNPDLSPEEQENVRNFMNQPHDND